MPKPKPAPPAFTKDGPPKQVQSSTVLKLEKTTFSGSVVVVYGHKENDEKVGAFTMPFIYHAESKEGIAELQNINFSVYCPQRNYRRNSRNDSSLMVDNPNPPPNPDPTKKDEKPKIYFWKTMVYVWNDNGTSTLDEDLAKLHDLLQGVLKKYDSRASSKQTFKAINDKLAKKNEVLVKVYPKFDQHLNDVSQTPYRPLDHVINDKAVREHLMMMYCADDDDPNTAKGLYKAFVDDDEQHVIESFFSRSGLLGSFCNMAIKDFGFPNGKINQSVAVAEQTLTGNEIEQATVRGSIAYKDNKRKYASEKDAIEMAKQEMLQDKLSYGKKLKRENTIESYFSVNEVSVLGASQKSQAGEEDTVNGSDDDS